MTSNTNSKIIEKFWRASWKTLFVIFFLKKYFNWKEKEKKKRLKKKKSKFKN
jgi:hypothetical protein